MNSSMVYMYTKNMYKMLTKQMIKTLSLTFPTLPILKLPVSGRLKVQTAKDSDMAYASITGMSKLMKYSRIFAEIGAAP